MNARQAKAAFLFVLSLQLSTFASAIVPTVLSLDSSGFLAFKTQIPPEQTPTSLYFRVPYKSQFESLRITGSAAPYISIRTQLCSLPKTVVTEVVSSGESTYTNLNFNFGICRPVGVTCDFFVEIVVPAPLTAGQNFTLQANFTASVSPSPSHMQSLSLDGTAVSVSNLPVGRHTIGTFSHAGYVQVDAKVFPAPSGVQLTYFPVEHLCDSNMDRFWMEGNPRYVVVTNSIPNNNVSVALQTESSVQPLTWSPNVPQPLVLDPRYEQRLSLSLNAIGSAQSIKNVSIKFEFPEAAFSSGSVAIAYSFGFKRPFGTIYSSIEPSFLALPYCIFGSTTDTLTLYLSWFPFESNQTTTRVLFTVVGNAFSPLPLQLGTSYTPSAPITNYQFDATAVTARDTLHLSSLTPVILIGTLPYVDLDSTCTSSYEYGMETSVTVPACDIGACYSSVSASGAFYVNAGAGNTFNITKRPPLSVVPGSTFILDHSNASVLVGPTASSASYPLALHIEVLAGSVRIHTLYPCGSSLCTRDYLPSVPRATVVISCEESFVSFNARGEFMLRVSAFLAPSPLTLTYPSSFGSNGVLVNVTARGSVALTTNLPFNGAIELEIKDSSPESDTVASIGPNCDVQDYPALTSRTFSLSRTTAQDSWRMSSTYRQLLLARTLDTSFRVNITKFGPTATCDSSFVPPSECTPYLNFPVGYDRADPSRVATAKDLFAALFPSEVASNTACYQAFINITCLSVVKYRCDPVTGILSQLVGSELCADRCVRLLSASCPSVTRNNARLICGPISNSCEYLDDSSPSPSPSPSPTPAPVPAGPSAPRSPTVVAPASTPTTAQVAAPTLTSASSHLSNFIAFAAAAVACIAALQ